MTGCGDWQRWPQTNQIENIRCPVFRVGLATKMGTVAQSVEHPSKGPGSRCNSTVGSNPSHKVVGNM